MDEIDIECPACGWNGSSGDLLCREKAEDEMGEKYRFDVCPACGEIGHVDGFDGDTDKPDARQPCPFCGSENLSVMFWSDDAGEFEAIECNDCLGAAPADKWDQRSGAGVPVPLDVPEEMALDAGWGDQVAIEIPDFLRRGKN